MSRSLRSGGLLLALLVSAGVAFAEDEKKAEEKKAQKAEPVTIATHDRWVTSLAFAPANNLLVTAGGQSLQYRPGDVVLWDASNGRCGRLLASHWLLVPCNCCGRPFSFASSSIGRLLQIKRL